MGKVVITSKGERIIMASTGNRRSSTFYRLEKEIGDGWKSVIEFHTVVGNNNKYYIEHEERPDGGTGYIGERRNAFDKEYGNKIYRRYKALGYKFAGIYEMDIYGKKVKIEEV